LIINKKQDVQSFILKKGAAHANATSNSTVNKTKSAANAVL